VDTAYTCLIVISFLMIGLCLFALALCITEKIMKKKVPLNSIFHDFGKKMWMAAGIGPLFFGLYFLVIYLATFTETTTRLDFFFLLYKYPVEFIYLGLFIFACTTVGIYCARIIIKYVYNSKYWRQR
jgi:hypothetical protein